MATRPDFGRAPFQLYVCPKCVSGEVSIGQPVLPIPIEFKKHDEWCIVVKCPHCRLQWYVCRQCTQLRAVLDTKKKLLNHSSKCHSGPLRHVGPVTHKKRKLSSVDVRSSKTYPTSRQFHVAPDDQLHGAPSNQLHRSSDDQLHRASDDYEPLEDDIVAPSLDIIPLVVAECNFSRTESTDYFSQNYNRMLGIGYIIAKCFYNNNKDPSQINDEDLQMILKLVLLVKSMSVTQSNAIGHFLKAFIQRIHSMEDQWMTTIKHSQSSVPKIYHSKLQLASGTPIKVIPFPTSAAEVRLKILDGKTSFLNLLPHPKIHILDDGHVFVLPSDCIKHFLAHGGVPMEFNNTIVSYPIRNVNESHRGVEIARNLMSIKEGKIEGKRHFNLSFLEWKDDCQPTKSNNNSKFALWLFTITIFKIDNGIDSPIGTFPVAIGPKNTSHFSVEEKISEDMKWMRSKAIPAFIGRTATTAPIPCTFSAELFLSLGDQPERRGGNVLMMGNSRTHARWRHCCDYSQLLDVLPACPLCFQTMVECDTPTNYTKEEFDPISWRRRKCNICCNWGTDYSDERLQFQRSSDFPKDAILGGEEGDGPLTPMIITYSSLEKVLSLTFRMVTTEKWNKTKAMAYLTDNCICDSFAELVVTHAQNYLTLKLAKEDRDDDERLRHLLRDEQANPKKYMAVDVPPLFTRGVPLHCFADTPMHLLFLGVCKSVCRRLGSWAGRRGRKAGFVSLARLLLQELDELKLSWMLLVPNTFCEKWGGWQSKHYASLTRVAVWIYGTLMTLDDGPPYEDPTGDPVKWKVEELKAWLRARRLDTSGNKPDLQPRVLDYMLGPPEKIPPILPNLYGSAADMLEMVQSLVLLVSTVFQDTVDVGTADMVDLRIRIFLTRFNIFDAPMRAEKTRPTWLSSYNYLCLLNLPEALNTFGPIRRWFEGKWLGERYVSRLKNERAQSGTRNVYYNLLRNLHRTKAIESIVQKHERTTSHANLLLNTKIYKSTTDIETKFHSRKPLPVVLLANNVIGCIYYTRGRNIGKQLSLKILLRTELLTEEDSIYHGLIYHQYQIAPETHSFDMGEIVDYGILLPRLGSPLTGVYTKVTKKWSTEMLGNHPFSVPYQHVERKVEMSRDDGSVIGAEWC